jgi:hypothetical protein
MPVISPTHITFNQSWSFNVRTIESGHGQGKELQLWGTQKMFCQFLITLLRKSALKYTEDLY